MKAPEKLGAGGSPSELAAASVTVSPIREPADELYQQRGRLNGHAAGWLPMLRYGARARGRA